MFYLTISAFTVEMESENEAVALDNVKEEDTGVDEDEAFPTTDCMLKETELVDEKDFHLEVITADDYVHHVAACIQEIDTVIQVYARISQKMEEMMQHDMSCIKVQFLKRGVDVLCQCHEVLMNTYIFAFYLKRNNQSLIFEDNLKDLENAREQLSEYLERDVTSEILVGIKQKVQDKTRYCESRRKVVLDHVHE